MAGHIIADDRGSLQPFLTERNAHLVNGYQVRMLDPAIEQMLFPWQAADDAALDETADRVGR